MKKVPEIAVAVLLMSAGCATIFGQSYQDSQASGVDLGNTTQVDSAFERHSSVLVNTSSYIVNATWYRNGTEHRAKKLTVDRSEQAVKIIQEDFDGDPPRVQTTTGDKISERDSWNPGVALPLPRIVSSLDFEQVETREHSVVYQAEGFRSGRTTIDNVDSISGELTLRNSGIISYMSIAIEYEENHNPETSRFVYNVSKADGSNTQTRE